MTTFTAQDFERRREEIEGREVGITTYRLGDRCFCKVDNVSPGALIARAVAATKAEAERSALEAYAAATPESPRAHLGV